MNNKAKIIIPMFLLILLLSVFLYFFNRSSFYSTKLNDNDTFYYNGWSFKEGTEVTITFSLTDDLLNEPITGTLRNMRTGEGTRLVLSTVENHVSSFARIDETGTYQFSVKTDDGMLITDKISATYQENVPISNSDNNPVKLLTN